MDKKKITRITDALLRGGLCACWVFGIPLTFLFFIAATAANNAAEQNTLAIKAVICFGVVVLGACAHSTLLNIRDDEDANG